MAEILTLVSDLSGDHGSPQDPVKPYVWRPLGADEDRRIDLTLSEYEKWRTMNEAYTAVSRPHQEAKTRTVGRRPRVKTEGGKAKEWARGHGVDLSLRGPCPEDVFEAYKADDPTKLVERVNGAGAH